MQKTLTFILCLSLSQLWTLGQNLEPLPLDQHGMITFSKINSMPEAGKGLLFSNAYDYIQSLEDHSHQSEINPKISADSSEISVSLSYTVYNEFPIRSPHGKIRYDLTVSVKESRYRHVATNFVFHYLKRNRYGKFVEVRGKSKPLETPLFKGQQKLWEQHKQQLHTKIASVTETLASYMSLPPNGPEKEIVNIVDDW